MAELSCGGSCMKYILFFFNIIFFITGAAILGVGIWLKVDPNASNILKVVDLNGGGSLMDTAIYILIGVGAFIFLVGFLGCCGACKESSCMLCLYAGLLVIVFLGEIVVAIMAIVFKGKISTELTKSMQQQVKTDVTRQPNNPVTLVWNTLQFNLKCCGAVNATDYIDNKYYSNDTNNPMPVTCCVMSDFNPDNPSATDYAKCVGEFNTFTGGNPSSSYQYLRTQGCYSALSEWVDKHAGILIGVGFGIALVQILGAFLACKLRSTISEQK